MMIKCSANYCKSNNNFVIIGLKKNSSKVKYSQTIKIVKNIINRGVPTKISEFLKEKIDYEIKEDDQDYLLLGEQKLFWGNTIKGVSNRIDNPALLFYEELLPKYLGDYAFVKNLVLPECRINDIIKYPKEEFKDLAVDFYIPQLNTVIEIDGEQHRKTEYEDAIRDSLLNKIVIRIPVVDVRNDTKRLRKGIEKIKESASRNELILKYKEQFSIVDQKKNTLIEIIRIQITLLELLLHGCLTFDKPWRINIPKVSKRTVELAILDLINWFNLVFKLQKIKVEIPQYELTNVDAINIDLDIYKKYDDSCYKDDVIFVRNDYFENYQKNYYKVEIDDNYKYSLNYKNENDCNLLKDVLYNIFGYDDFRKGQDEIIMNVLALKDTIGILPTGSGKSLCYQLSALLQPGITFIICPLKSLLKDQEDSMKNRFIDNNARIDSSQESTSKKEIIFNLSRGKYQMIWTSPERFQSEDFRDALFEVNQKYNVAYAVIDEVHCMSEWGHNFRTSYLQLISTIRRYTPQATIVGLTATASDHVMKDLKYEFCKDSNINEKDFEKNHIVTTLDFIRKELEFKIINCKEKDKKNVLFKQLQELQSKRNVLEKRGEDTLAGIIFDSFAGGKRGCKTIAQDISKEYNKYSNNIAYYVGRNDLQSDASKMKIQDEFKKDEKTLLVATKSFGMGIDKSNIRYVIHFGMPASIEALYQEVGRAGRGAIKAKSEKDSDNKCWARCYIIHAEPDYKNKEKERKIFDQGTSISEIKEILDTYGSWERGDIFDQMQLFMQNESEDESKEIFKTYLKYLKGNTKFEIKLNSEEELGKIEKHIYKLSLLGIVADWTVTYNPGYVLRGESRNLSENEIRDYLNNYIRRYENDFNFNILYNTEKYPKISEIMNQNCDQVEKYISILCTWYYENIIYYRRTALDVVDSFLSRFDSNMTIKESTDIFNKTIKAYFSPENYMLILKYIVEGSFINALDIFDKVIDYNDLRASLDRILTENRFNNILNLMSGITNFMIGNKDTTNIESFEKALKEITLQDNRMEIYEKILSICKNMSKGMKKLLNNSLKKYFNSIEELILNYKYFNTKDTIKDIIKIEYNKVEGIERRLIDGSRKNG